MNQINRLKELLKSNNCHVCHHTTIETRSYHVMSVISFTILVIRLITLET